MMINPDDRLITQPYDATIEDLLEQMESGEIIFPAFQRDFIWSNEQASSFVESVLLGVPTPMILFVENDEETYQVIDGRQRLESLFRFIKKEGTEQEIRLERLQIRKDLDGKTFSELSLVDQKKLLNQYLKCLVIVAGASMEMVLYIYESLNAKGVSLTKQEIDRLHPRD